MTDVLDERHQIGGNAPPPEAETAPDPVAAWTTHIDDLYTEAKNWCDETPIETPAQLAEVERLIGLFKEAIKGCEDSRDGMIQPLTEATKTIRERFYPLIGDTTKIKGSAIKARESLLAVKSAYVRKEQRRKDEEALALRKEADRKAQEAADAARAALGNLQAVEDAEALIQEAKDAQRAVKQAEKPVSKGMRQNWLIKGFAPVETDGKPVSGQTALLRHYYERNPQALLDACLALARTDIHNGVRTIPGLVIENEPVAF